MHPFLGPLGNIGGDIPGLVSPIFDARAALARLLDAKAACDAAERRFQRLAASATASQHRRRELRFERRLAAHSKAHAAALAALESLGVGVGAVHHEGRLYSITRDDYFEDSRPMIVVVELAGLIDLG